MKVLWKSDLGQGKHDPLEIVAVETKTGSRISAELVVPLDPSQTVATPQAGDVSGLLEVIDAQMEAIGALEQKIGKPAKDHEALQEWADQFPDMIADLCVALGFAAHPVGPTGIPELDILVSLSR